MKNIPTMSHLTDRDAGVIDYICEQYERMRTDRDPNENKLSSFLTEVDVHLRMPLLGQLLPIEIKFLERSLGQLPTLCEVQDRNPELRAELPAVYQLLPSNHRLPDWIAQYRVVKLIDEGTQATVFRAVRDGFDGRSYAIKLAKSKIHSELLEHEAEFLAAAEHPNIVNIVDKGHHDGKAYFVMEYLRGDNLDDARSHRHLNTLSLARIGLQIAEAVAHLHSLGIVHRDLKPSNIHLDFSGTVRLFDLGMAIDVDSWALVKKPLKDVGGTRAYQAPEHRIADPAADGKLSDIYSVGATLFYLITGEHPLPPSVDGAPEPLNRNKQLLADAQFFSDSLKSVCLKAMSASPIDRHETAYALADALKQIEQQKVQQRRLLKTVAFAAVAAAFPLCVLALLAAGYVISQVVGGGSVRDGDLPDHQPTWLEETATDLDIDLASLGRDDFRVSIEKFHSYDFVTKSMRVRSKLVVEVDDSLHDLIRGLEYRVGTRPWRTILVDTIQGTHYGMLSSKDVSENGPVELRLNSDAGRKVGYVVGPFVYDIEVESALQASIDRTERLANAAADDAIWFKSKQAGYAFSDEFVENHITNVDLIRLGGAPGHLNVTISPRDAFGSGFGADAMRFTYDGKDRLNTQLRSAVEGISSKTLYVQLVYADGSNSPIKSFELFNSIGFDGTISAAKKYIAAPPENIDLATCKSSKLTLEGLAKVASSIKLLRVGSRPDNLSREISLNYLRSPSRTKQPPTPGYDYHSDENRRIREENDARLTLWENRDNPVHYSLNVKNGFPTHPISIPPYWKRIFIQAEFTDGQRSEVVEIENADASAYGLAAKLVPQDEAQIAEQKPELHVGLRFTGGSPSTLDLHYEFMAVGPDGYGATFLTEDSKGQLREHSPHVMEFPRQIYVAFTNEQDDKQGPYKFAIEHTILEHELTRAVLPIIREQGHEFFTIYRFVRPEGSSRGAFYGRSGNVFYSTLVSTEAVKSSRASVTLIAGKQCTAAWHAIKTIEVVDSNHNKTTIDVAESPKLLLAPWESWYKLPPVFVTELPDDSTTFTVSMTLMDGSSVEPFELPIDTKKLR